MDVGRYTGMPEAAARHKAFVLICLAALMVCLLGCNNDKQPPLPSWAPVPGFALTNQSNASFGTEQLRGKVWVANFIFTRCPTVCPGISRMMSYLQENLEKEGLNVMLVSFSVDPDFDTPEVLDAYARRYSADPARWHFLTGPSDAVHEAVRGGFKMAMEKVETVGEPPDILHGTQFVLVDKELQIRAYHDSNDPEFLGNVLRDAKRLTTH